MRRTQIAVVLVVAAVMFSCNSPDFTGQSHLPDEQLIENLKAHRAEFEKLVAMIIEDKTVMRVDEDWTHPKDFDQKRTTEYRKLFQVVGIPRGFSAPTTREHIEFIASSQGWVAHGSSKGYLYGERCPEYIGKTVESLDGMSLVERPSGSGCRHIDGKWYLYFMSD